MHWDIMDTNEYVHCKKKQYFELSIAFSCHKITSCPFFLFFFSFYSKLGMSVNMFTLIQRSLYKRKAILL